MKKWEISLSGETQESALEKLKELTNEFERLTKVNVPVKRLYFQNNYDTIDCKLEK